MEFVDYSNVQTYKVLSDLLNSPSKNYTSTIKSCIMFKKRLWYKEVIILCLIIPFATIPFTLLIGIPKSVLYYLPLLAGLPLLIVIMIWRIRKKAITLKESTVMILLYTGLNYAIHIFVPWPSSFFVSFVLVLVIIWRVHKRAIS